MEEIILKDKTEITIKEGASLNSITAVVEQFKDLDSIASALMKGGNLDTVEFKHEGEVTGSYTDMRLEYPLFQVNVVNEKVEATFAIREKTEEEKMASHIALVTLSLQLNCAIVPLIVTRPMIGTTPFLSLLPFT